MLSTRLATVISVLWIAGVAIVAGQNWPAIPLDVSANDPATIEAYRAASMAHVLRYAAVALVPALVLIGLAKVFRRGS